MKKIEEDYQLVFYPNKNKLNNIKLNEIFV